MLRAVDQPQRRPEHDGARAFGSHQRARDVKPVFRKQLIEVVARHATRDLRKAAPYALSIPVANRSQRRVNLSATSALPDDRVELRFGRRADRQLGAVVEQNRRARARCRRSCRRSASACRTSCCRSCRRGCSGCASTDPGRTSADAARPVPAQRVEDDAGLHAGDALLDIDLENAVHVLREVEHDGDVAALAGEARAGAAREDRRVERSGTPPPPRARRLRRAARRRRWEPGGSSRRRSRTSARLPRSKRTSPRTVRRSSLSSSAARPNVSIGFP